METNGLADAQGALIEFLGKMKRWEEENFYALSEALENENIEGAKLVKTNAKNELVTVFEESCIARKCDRRRVISNSMKSPSTYDPIRDTLSVEIEAAKECVFLYQQAVGLKTSIKFYMALYKNEWKISKAEFFSGTDQKWLPWIL